MNKIKVSMTRDNKLLVQHPVPKDQKYYYGDFATTKQQLEKTYEGTDPAVLDRMIDQRIKRVSRFYGWNNKYDVKGNLKQSEQRIKEIQRTDFESNNFEKEDIIELSK